MRKIRDLLRLRWEHHLPQGVISRSLGLSHGLISDYLSRACRAGLTWPEAQDDVRFGGADVFVAAECTVRPTPGPGLGRGAKQKRKRSSLYTDRIGHGPVNSDVANDKTLHYHPGGCMIYTS